MEKNINKKITLYSKVEKPDIIFVFSHGSNGNKESQFIRSISSQLVALNPKTGVVAYDFDFVAKKEALSEDLGVEMNNLAETLEWVKKSLDPSKIVLLGKSFGGVVNMKYLAGPDSSDICKIEKSFVLGLPFKLGFPPQLSLLKEKTPTLPPYQKEYRAFFEVYKQPMVIVQGDSDDLCGVGELRECIKNSVLCTCVIIPGVNHSFMSSDGNNEKLNYYSECTDAILKNI